MQGNIVGLLMNPKGCILHGTRSGQAYTKLEEYNSTVNFVRSGAIDSKGNRLGWSVTIGTDRYCVHSHSYWGWNAGEHSDEYVAAEFAQSHEGEAITPQQLDMFEHWWRTEVKPKWPDIPLVFINHSELPQGIAAGKTDAFPRGFEAEALRARIIERLT